MFAIRPTNEGAFLSFWEASKRAQYTLTILRSYQLSAISLTKAGISTSTAAHGVAENARIAAKVALAPVHHAATAAAEFNFAVEQAVKADVARAKVDAAHANRAKARADHFPVATHVARTGIAPDNAILYRHFDAVEAIQKADREAASFVEDARTASDAGFPAARDATFAAISAAASSGAALEHDLAAVRSDSRSTINRMVRVLAAKPLVEGAASLLATPLWPQSVPEEIVALWQTLQTDLIALDPSFEIWIDWYQARLDGKPLDWELERQWAILPDNLHGKGADEINEYLKVVRDLRARSATSEDAPEIPESQTPGLQFAPQEDGKIGLKQSGFAPPNDLAEIATMRGVTLKATDNLVAMTAGSNELAWVAGVAGDYRREIAADKPSVDAIYCYGLWLENAHSAVKAQIETHDYPDIAPAAAAAINTVIAVHGPMIASTARGQVLMARSRDIAELQADVATYRAAARKFADAIAASNAVTKDTCKVVKRTNANIGQGPHPERSTEVARTANRNILIAQAKVIVVSVAISTTGSVLATPIAHSISQTWPMVATAMEFSSCQIWRCFANSAPSPASRSTGCQRS